MERKTKSRLIFIMFIMITSCSESKLNNLFLSEDIVLSNLEIERRLKPLKEKSPLLVTSDLILLSNKRGNFGKITFFIEIFNKKNKLKQKLEYSNIKNDLIINETDTNYRFIFESTDTILNIKKIDNTDMVKIYLKVDKGVEVKRARIKFYTNAQKLPILK
jgi:hypothetical protein